MTDKFNARENFNAKEQAGNVEYVGYRLLHDLTGGDFSKLNNELAALNPLQAEALNEQLEWNRWKPTTDPNVKMYRDKSGYVKGLYFTPAVLDTTARRHNMYIGIGKGDKTAQKPEKSDGQVFDQHGR